MVVLNNLASSLKDSEPRKALENPKKALSLNPESVNALDTLAIVLLHNGEKDKAKRAIEDALDKSPDNPAVRYHSAMIDAESGRTSAAVDTLKALLETGVNFTEEQDARKLLEQLQ